MSLTAHVLFVLVAGLLVFGFAAALRPAVEKQRKSACRALEPEPRSGAAPELAAVDLQGRPVSLSDLAGKLVVLNFWATYCEPCTREWPELDRLAARLADRDDVVVVAVSLDDDRAKIAPYLARLGLSDTSVQVWWDPSGQGQANKPFGSEKLPDTFFVDGEGELAAAFINAREWGKPAAFACVEATAEG